MKGHIQWRGPRTARLYVDAGRDPNTGRRRQRTRTVADVGKREAQNALRAFIAEVEDEVIYGGRSNLTVGRALRAWLAHVADDLEPSTVDGYRRKVETHVIPHLGTVPLAKLTPDMLDGLYRHLRTQGSVGRGRSSKGAGRPLSARTVRHVHRIVHTACEYARRKRWIRDNPAELADPPGLPVREVIPPAGGSLGAVVDAAPVDLGDVAVLAIDTGARAGELAGLRWSDLDVEHAQLTIARRIVVVDGRWSVRPYTKNERPRTIALAAITVERLIARRLRSAQRALACGVPLEPAAYVLSDDPDGATPLRPGTMSQRWRRHAGAHGLACRFHDLRHFAATEWAAAGVSDFDAAARGGWRSVRMFHEVYGHARRARDHQAAEASVGALRPKG